MIEIDEKGNVPPKDQLCRVYHVAGVNQSKAWSGFNTWSGDPYWKEKIEAYDTFRGWATPEIHGRQRSSQPAETDVRELPVRLRIALCRRGDGVQYLDVWSSDSRESQANREQSRAFVAWVTDTLEPLPALSSSKAPTLAEELELMAVQSEPLTQRQRDILRAVADKLKQAGE